ncbi:helix-turn-helix domain-containing protein [Mucilaginibacter ginsenosidivorax]|uniref:Helix-turn-helix transcriptional regulator n=1 Tax=Mucilaginibacter ginsenosidivorax TaxID=862126 RepID=A0A5B8W2T5_9SPHI|nr:AraC family transcriptional regulator [Mucilaginibacter ginsenosidivorax]QEC78370.1 helix-turn-helix transcriptional regulator [Mucilaginibacter ginsenosidivorax]
MTNIYIPQATENQRRITAGDISFVHYAEKDSLQHSRVVFNCYAISFVINGEKAIFRPANNTIVGTGEGIVIPEGNSIMAEHTLNNRQYSSILIFFSSAFAQDFLNRHKLTSRPNTVTPDYIKFRQTNYIAGYVKSIQTLIQEGQNLPYLLAANKVEELLLVLLHSYGSQLTSLLRSNTPLPELLLKNVVENNLFNNLTLDELAFLANKSLASFKRDFEKVYHMPPGKYIRERKLEVARQQLEQGKNATSLYIDFGYDNLSNFSSAFKRKFGVSPKQYQMSAQEI